MKTAVVAVIAIGTAILILGLHSLQSGLEPERRCTDPSGRLLYVVRGAEVRNKSGQLLGTIKNGEVRDSSGRLVAHNGDAGLLCCNVVDQ